MRLRKRRGSTYLTQGGGIDPRHIVIDMYAFKQDTFEALYGSSQQYNARIAMCKYLGLEVTTPNISTSTAHYGTTMQLYNGSTPLSLLTDSFPIFGTDAIYLPDYQTYINVFDFDKISINNLYVVEDYETTPITVDGVTFYPAKTITQYSIRNSDYITIYRDALSRYIITSDWTSDTIVSGSSGVTDWNGYHVAASQGDRFNIMLPLYESFLYYTSVAGNKATPWWGWKRIANIGPVRQHGVINGIWVG